MITPFRNMASFFSMVAITLAFVSGMHADVLVKSGEKIVFLGDSITHQGGGAEGWCTLVVSGLKTIGIEVEQVNAGKGGNTSRDMAARVENDVISKKPAWMTLLCGTNDNPNHGLPLDESKKNIKGIVEKAQAAGIKVIILTMPVRGAKFDESDYNEYIRSFAKEKKIPCADVFAEMKKMLMEVKKKNPALAKSSTPLLAIPDGTHMNPRGNQVIAQCVLTAFGLSPEQISKVKESWPVIPLPDADAAKSKK